MNIYIFLFYFVVADKEIFEFRIDGQEKKWKCAIISDNVDKTNIQEVKILFDYVKSQIKSEDKFKLSLQKGNGDFASTNVNKFLVDFLPEVDAQLGDIILGDSEFHFILGNIMAYGYKIGYIIQPGDEFKSLFGS